MPELPEVETVRRGLERLVVGKKVISVEVKFSKIIKTDEKIFLSEIANQEIKAIDRRGKYLIFDFGDNILISHLRMEGKYLLFDDEIPDNKHFHIIFNLDDESTLVYQDVRKFGTMEWLPKNRKLDYFKIKKIGPEPNEKTFQLKPFQKSLSESTKKIKPLLLEQRLVAGLGNIYVDEVLWSSKIHPMRIASSLKKFEVEKLHDEIIRILQLAIEKGGSTIRSYRNALGEDGTMQNYLNIYGLVDQPCSRCGTTICKIKVGGRGSYFCPKCQIL